MPAPRLIYGTRVRNPTHHGTPYRACSACEKLYTHLGIARHWPHCEEMRKRKAALEFALGRKGLQGELPL